MRKQRIENVQFSYSERPPYYLGSEAVPVPCRARGGLAEERREREQLRTEADAKRLADLRGVCANSLRI